MRLPTTLLLLAIAGFGAFKMVRKPSAPEPTVQVDPVQAEARRQDSIRYAEWEASRQRESLRDARARDAARNNEVRGAMTRATAATLLSENRIAQPPAPTKWQQEQEEMAHCSAVPQYGPHGNIVGWAANPDCAEYRRRHPR